MPVNKKWVSWTTGSAAFHKLHADCDEKDIIKWLTLMRFELSSSSFSVSMATSRLTSSRLPANIIQAQHEFSNVPSFSLNRSLLLRGEVCCELGIRGYEHLAGLSGSMNVLFLLLQHCPRHR